MSDEIISEKEWNITKNADGKEYKFIVKVTEKEFWTSISVNGRDVNLEENDVLKLYSPMTIAGKKIGGISIPHEIAEEIREMRGRTTERSMQREQRRKDDRPAPILDLDAEGLFMFWYGCDTGLEYPESHRHIIAKLREEKVEYKKIFTGTRDNTREFPGMTDKLIPQEYVKVVGKDEYGNNIYAADGYHKVWVDAYAFPKSLVDAEYEAYEKRKREAEEEKNRKLNEEYEERERIYNNTKPHTGKPWTCSYCGKEGATWKRETKAGIKYACENGECVDQLMKEHEVWARKQGWVKCWECGCWGPADSMTYDEGMPYCGC